MNVYIRVHFTRVIFGVAPSQYLLNTVIRKHAKYKISDSDFEEIVKSNFYVDDLNTSVKSSDEGIDFYHKCKIRFADAGYNIRKWRTNNEKLKNILTENEVKYDDLANGTILGINWNSKDDLLILKFEEFFSDITENVTRRQIVKVMAGVYDLVGWIQPIVIKLKLLFQEACKLQIGWDDMVPEGLNKRWQNTIEQIRKLKEIVLPRCYSYSEVTNPIVKVVMHSFSDATLTAYGGCVYLKFIKKNGDANMSLIASKSRVAPIRNAQTIPQLELMGNLILSRLIVSIISGSQEKVTIDIIYCHTDSQISLSWIKATKKEFKPFVQNRVIETRQKTKPENCFYCKPSDNPADFLTRADNNGINEPLWWNGPDYLKEADFYDQDENVSPGILK